MDILILILVILRLVVSNRIRSETMDRVVVDQKLTIPCGIKMAPYSGLLQWLFKPHDSVSYKLICMKKAEESDCVNKHNTEHWLENIMISMETLEIDKVAPHHSGTYQCKYMDSSNLERFMIIVNVLTPPGKPKIHTSTMTLVEDKIVTLTCESFGGNPKPLLKWVWKDFSNKPIPKRNIINQTLIQNNSVYGQSVLTVLWTPKHFDDGNSISCLAENQIASVSSNWMYLNVNYRPIIFDFPTSPHFVLLGTDISFECKATRKTATTFSWWSDKEVMMSDTAQLMIKSISKIHKGSYRCSVTNPFGTTSASVNITVLSTPAIDVVKDLIVTEGEELKVSCKVVPATSNVSWWINSQCISVSSLLELKLNDTRPLELQCRASVLLNKFPGRHVIANSKEIVHVTVHYRPRRPSIAVHPIGFLMAGIDATITCVSDQKEPGLPKPDYLWQKSNSKWTKNYTNFLSFSSLTFNDSGVYICTLFNRVGKSKEVSYDLVVYGQPVLIDSSLQSPSLIKVKDGHAFSMVCHFQSYPAPEISWFNDDFSIPNHLNISGYRLDNKQTSNNGFMSILHVEKIVFKTIDMYRCLATNKYGTLHHEYSIQVQYPPKLVSDTFMIAADSRGLSATKEPIHLNCSVSGTPNITIVWFRKLLNNNENTIENSTERHFIRERLYANVVENVMFVRNFQNEDFGRYFCLAKNGEGHLEAEFEIRKLTIPDLSHDLIVTKTTWHSLTFKWIPGFDGGYPQTFIVAYSTDMQTKPIQLRISEPNLTLNNLLPDTSYTISVSSSNNLGTTQATLSTKVKTEAFIVGDEKILTVNKEEQTLELKLPSNLSSNIFCLTVEEMDYNQQDLIGSWTLLKRCVKDAYNKIPIDKVANKFRIRICLITYPDVCSSPMTSSPIHEAAEMILSTRLIGTVATACTILVIVLAMLLFFILIRTRKLFPGLSGLKEMKRNRKSSRDDITNYISKPSNTLCHNPHGMMMDSGGCPLLNTYSCDQVHLSSTPIEIFNVCSTHNIFNEGLYSTLVKSSSINLFSNNVSPAPALNDLSFIDQSPCCCHSGDQQICNLPVPEESTTKSQKIFYEVMV